ncbi:MAG: YajQ family cyclic di-GMP-binding protein [Granulosicoccaceae bacterium]
MPSFDVVSEVDGHELQNAVDQVNREIGNRFDFKGADAKVENNQNVLTLSAQSDFQVKQIRPMLYEKLAKRGIDVQCLDEGNIEQSGMRAHQRITVREGLDKETAKKVVKLIKESKVKVQAAVQGEQVRVTGKKRDDLQQTMQMLRGAEIGLPLQYNNFRD